MDEPELLWLADQARAASTIIEVGTWKGRSARALAEHCPGLVYVVDNWTDAPAEPHDQTGPEIRDRGISAIEAEWRANLQDLIASERIRLARGNSPDVAPTLRPLLGAGADLVFIDADHSIAGVTADICAFLPLVRAGGIISGHDYSTDVHPGVRVAVDRFFGDRVRRGPGSIWWVRCGL